MRTLSALRSPIVGIAALCLSAAGWSAACTATGDLNDFDEDSTKSAAGDPGGTTTSNINLDGGNGTGTFSDANCGASTYANAVPANVLVVLDKSGSMAGGDGQPDKWAPTVSALNLMMNSASPDLSLGLMPFPEGKFQLNPFCAFNMSDPMCKAQFADGGCKDVNPTPVVAVGPLSSTKQPISAWLAANSPNGGTPTLHALKMAYASMQSLNAQGELFVLLMTDGEPNTYQPAMFGFPETNLECGELSDIEAEALKAASASPSVKTFVIGSPGSEPAGSFLSQLAINGQTPRSPACSAAAKDCHYQIGKGNFQADLEAALAEIAGAVSDCIFAIPDGSSQVDPDLVNLVIETSKGTVETFKDPAHKDGWDYTDQSKKKIQLFGPACEDFKAEKGSKASIILGCETIVK